MKTTKHKAKTLSAYSFNEKFPNEQAAREFVERLIWGDKPICPICKGVNTIPRPARKGQHCTKCRVDFSVRVGTIFENSRLPLHKWLYAIYLLQTARKGISSLQLSKEIDITQKTAWFMLHRLRESCDLSAIQLNGVVEVDETYLGGKECNKHANSKLNAGRGIVGKTPIIGARERGGRVVAKVIKNTKAESMQFFILDNVKLGSDIMTDEHRAYTGLGKGYNHSSVCHSAKEYVKGMAHTNGIESVWALLKRGFNGTYHNWSRKHTQRYVNEFAFRLNQGNYQIDTIDRIAAVVRDSLGKRLTYRDLTSIENTAIPQKLW